MNNLLGSLMQQAMKGQLQNNPLMGLYNQMMNGKNKQQQIETLLNSARSKGIDINKKMFSENDLKMLKLK